MIHGVVNTLLVVIGRTRRETLQTGLPQIQRVEYRDPETCKAYVLMTSRRHWTAQTTAEFFKSRWWIALLFR